MNILASMERSSQLRLNDSILFLTHLALIKNVKFFESIYFLTAKGLMGVRVGVAPCGNTLAMRKDL